MNQPNIIFVLIDDMGWRDLSCYGSSFYETPHIDRLAGESMRFTDAYAACPVCSPTRASILTGKYPATVGVTNYIGKKKRGRLIDAPYVDHLPLEECSLARALKQGGYATWHVGKWHLGGPEAYPDRHGFDVNRGGCHWGMLRNGYFSPWGLPTLEDGPKGEYMTDRLTDEAIGLIERHDPGERPFFLNLWYYAVHIPTEAKADKIAKYEQKAKDLGLDKLKTFEEGEHFPTEQKRDQRVTRRLVQSDPAYAAMIESLDENIGRLLAAVEAAGQSDNTIVVFTSDNGGMSTAEGSPTCNAPLSEGKGWMYEGGTREPLMVRWPGVVEEGGVCDVPVTSPDFYPTLLDAAGLDPMPEQHCDGVSLMPLLRAGRPLRPEAALQRPIFWHYPHYGVQGGTPGSSVRLGDFKLIEFFEDGRLELYDLRRDPGEKHNLAGEQPDRVKELRALLVDWRNKVDAKLPSPNPDWFDTDNDTNSDHPR